MKEEMQNVPKLNSPASALAKIPVVESAPASECTSHQLLMYIAIASMVVGCGGALFAIWMASRSIDDAHYAMLTHFFDQHRALVLDHVLLLVLGVSAILGVAVMQIDIHEMIQELQKTSKPQIFKVAPSATTCVPVLESSQSSECKSHQFLKYVALASMVIGSCGATCAMWMCVRSLAEVFEIPMLADFFDACFRDTALMLVLGAGAVLGVAVMETDVHGMKEEMQNAAKPKASTSSSVPVVEKTQASQCLSHQFLKYVALASVVIGYCGAAMTSLGMTLGMLGVTLGMAWTFLVVTSDQCLMLVLGSSAAFGAVLSHVDIHEMSEDLRKQKAD